MYRIVLNETSYYGAGCRSVIADEIRKLQSLESSIQKSIKEFLGVTTKVRLMEPHSIQRSEGKAKRIIDKRPTE